MQIKHHLFKKMDNSCSCKLCGKSFIGELEIVNHMKTHDAEINSYACNFCPKIFISKIDFDNHIESHTEEKPFACDICNKIFPENDALTEHQRIHLREKPYVCDICKKRFPVKAALTEHQRIHFLNEHQRIHLIGKPYVCDICKKRFPVKAALTEHQRIHLREEPFPCDICHKRFPVKAALDVHQRIHLRVKPFVCDICKKIFPVKAALTEHQRIHLREEPFPCDICYKRFPVKAALDVHQRIHLREKPFVCDICKTRFPFKIALNLHQRIHLREEPFSCDICHKTFPVKAALTVHQRIHLRTLSDFQSRKEECERSKFKREERWLLLWAMEYAKVKHTNYREECEEWERIFYHHCPIKKDISRKRLRSQKYYTLQQKYFTEEDLKMMQDEVNTMINNSICPFENSLELPSNNMPPQKMNRHSTSRSLSQPTPRIDTPIDRSPQRGQSMVASPEPSNPLPLESDSDFDQADNLDRLHKGNESLSTTRQPDNPQMEPDLKQQVLEELSIPIEERGKPYTCSFCPKRFSTKTICNNHMRTHTGERPYVCDICYKSFAVKTTLEFHRRTHTGEKRYICEICNKGFIWRTQLKRHTIMNHTGVGAAFLTNSLLQHHRKKKHANDTSDTGPDSEDELYEQDIIDSESDFGKGVSHLIDYHPEEVYIPAPVKVENEHIADSLHESFSQQTAWLDGNFEEVVKTEPFIKYDYDSN